MENGDQPPIQCDIFIPGQFILSQLTRARARRASTSSVPWIAWQDYSRECRLFNTLRRCSGSVYGARYAFEGKVRQSTETAQSSLDGRLILIRHFGEPAAILRDTDVDSFTEDNEGGGAVKPRVYAVLEPSDELNRDIWTKPMWTGAPYL
ncbi:uncharacterized protein PHACADRAFT_246557 [Phanerochaete carnosa HHB-10118-sp]|uniref:Uncharacterized protein n=1 Tax=Phanerochaete carnosa (strain HHB-10118-sp) TaxID=650164 RepID=K5XC30_PHACS|nr:uncharacterized protein PHACADRAFT_246557 [Phanerochaete carnosa HHB-10118-sp]EKM60547.1 hypothetical protein PHACADRAFT_246557 [Phanerochaete carnosa HHB-10118-sp]